MNLRLPLRLSGPSNTRGKNVASPVLRVVLDNSSIVSYGGGRRVGPSLRSILTY